jgi:hypothetical protein
MTLTGHPRPERNPHHFRPLPLSRKTRQLRAQWRYLSDGPTKRCDWDGGHARASRDHEKDSAPICAIALPFDNVLQNVGYSVDNNDEMKQWAQ